MLQSIVNRKLLFTGGSGYLATNLINSIKDTDCDIVRVARPGTRFVPAVGRARIEDVAGDVRELSVWMRLLRQIDVVFHLAAQTSVYVANENPIADMEVNVRPMLYLLETCRQQGWGPIVLFSGTATEAGLSLTLPVNESHPDNPITVYDLHKLMAEKYLKYYVSQRIVRGVTLRLANVYGPGPTSRSKERGVLNQMVRRALAGETLTIHGHGRHVRDYIYIDDVNRAFLAAVENIDRINGQHLVVGSGQAHTVVEALTLVADRVALKTGRRPPIRSVEPPQPRSPIESRNFVADSTRFSQATAWKPAVTLAEGIDRTIEAFLAEERVYS